MERHLNWTKGLLDSSYQLFEGGEIRHTLFFDIWNNQARAISQQSTYLFKGNGFLNSTTQVFDNQNNLIGMIQYHTWQNKAIFTLTSGEAYHWTFTNSWYSKWMITDSKTKQINYDADLSSGAIMANTDDEIMLLTGLYIKEHYHKVIYLVLFILFVTVICGSGF
ncbi:hypothetical protein [Pedobacter sp. Hv1]|uniref:hypothetical protein n=1 Tax=Pedobacter sp. Hv1 TaxID=1740090 RepID=UPI0006D8C7E5|nr:hypothetical protein [Pedobacter sp. Hv1]KQC02173.1 hypothetical protein AQF98_00945 [Pedobacter sp. Hv1]